VDVTEAARRLDAPGEPTRPLLLDVREVNEFRVLRVPGASLIPMSTIAERYQELPADRPILVMCAAGSRSLAVAEFLGRNGYPDVANVTGGITAWQRAGLPVSDALPGPDEGRLPGS
jgi:rhodanese-related sulfurtransferase